MKFSHPFSAIIAGSSGTGKTVLTRSFLEDYKMTTTITKPVLKVWWCHGQAQDLHQERLPGVDIVYYDEFLSDFDCEDKPDIVVYDDLMSGDCRKQGTHRRLYEKEASRKRECNVHCSKLVFPE